MVTVKSRALPSSLRRANERTLVALLMRMGSASRAQLAKAAGISQPTCGKIIDELLRLGVVLEEEDDSPREKAGRPGRMVRLDSSKPRFLIIQIDVVETSFALVPVGAGLEDKWDCKRPTTDSAQSWQKQARIVAKQLKAEDLWGVLVSVPGIVDEKAGRVVFSPNVHWSEKTDLPKLINQVWDAPVVLVQENRAAALGHLFAESNYQNFLLVDFGHGVGGAIIEGGRLFHSPLPLNAEFGHTPIPGNHRQCGCGATGCLETKLSRTGLLHSFAEANRGQPETWEALIAHVNSHGIKPWLAESLDAAGSVIAGALNVLGIRQVVVTGSLTEMPPRVIEHLAATIRQGSMWGRFGSVTCEGAPHRRIAGMAAAGIDRLLVPADGKRKFG
ncbi:MAG: N-acetylglucosamine repressor [Verrucomicrobiota bacterium]|jgi:predicted NBD/HSP70 family sugar kinase